MRTEIDWAIAEIRDEIKDIRVAMTFLQDGEAKDYLRALLYRKGDALQRIRTEGVESE